MEIPHDIDLELLRVKIDVLSYLYKYHDCLLNGVVSYSYDL